MSRYFLHKCSLSDFRRILILLFLFTAHGFSQTKTNLEVLYSLNNSLVTRICRDLPAEAEQISIKLNMGKVYSVFSNHITNEFIKRGKKPSRTSTSGSNPPEINIVFDKAGVTYAEIERDGWFGKYLSPRTLFIKGNYLNSLSGKGLEEFYIDVTDTIRVDEISSLENDSFPFTKGNIPPEPFLSSLIEPVIAIGVAALSIILFFTVRSQ